MGRILFGLLLGRHMNAYWPLREKSVFDDILPGIEKFENTVTAQEIADRYSKDVKKYDTDCFVMIRLEKKFKEGVVDEQSSYEFKDRFAKIREITQRFFEVKCPEFQGVRLEG